MGRVSKFSEEQKYEIALDLVSGKLSHAEVCRKWGISSTYAYKLKDRALEILRQGIGRPAGRPDGEKDALKDKNSVVITDEIAVKYYGNENPIGKQIIINPGGETEYSFFIRGVIENGAVAHWQITMKVGFTLDEDIEQTRELGM